MTAVTIIAFYGTFIIAVPVVYYIAVNLRNQKAKIATDKFIAQAYALNPQIMVGIKLQRYWVSSGKRTWIYLNSNYDLYLFDNYLALVRRSHFIFDAFYEPVKHLYRIIRHMPVFTGAGDAVLGSAVL